jgi:hypothetical protein
VSKLTLTERAAASNPAVARRFGNGFSDPADFQHWFMAPDRAEEYLATVSMPAGNEAKNGVGQELHQPITGMR